MIHVRRTPDMIHGDRRAWRMPDQPDKPAVVSAWLVNAYDFHPAWTYWLVCVIHLKDYEGQEKPPIRQFPGASHEFLIVSLQSPPGNSLEPDPDVIETIKHLSPPDMVHQNLGITDLQAEKLVHDIVHAAVHSGQSLDSDFRTQWSSALALACEHMRLGGHPPG